MSKHKALLIPWDEREPVIEVPYGDSGNSSYEQLRGYIFGDDPELLSHGTLSVSTIHSREGRVGLFYDDEGLYTQPHSVNVRAMKLWAHLAGRRVGDFVQPLVGNYLAYGVDDYGETTDVPRIARRFFGEEGISEDD